jgi:hypothetical protein
MRTLVFLITALVWLTAVAASAGAQPYSFQQAAELGMVYLAPSHDAGENDRIIRRLSEINPGIVEGLGYLWGGPTEQRLAYAATIAAKVRQQLPRVLLGAAWSEGIRPGYDEVLHCGGSLGERRFTVDEISWRRPQGQSSVWVDLSKPAAVSFYDCVGQIYIDRGFTVLRFEAPTLMLRYSAGPATAAEAFARVAVDMRAYAARRGQPIYFIGDPNLARYVHLDGVYVPSRFYHTTLASALKYQNRISRPAIGVGYSYALSPLIVRETVDRVPAGTKVFFDVDNWDPRQDDLRRFMELDHDNRRFLILQSARNARQGGAYFIPPLDHCGGCVPRDAVIDPCEVLPNGSTEYNAMRCRDLAVINEALHPQ